jgi:MFS superfamily sulfate permease-like transporter
MLAAIGIIIISKQTHILFNLAPVNELGKALSEPLDLILAIPHSIMNADPAVAMIGVLSMLTVVIWPKININWLRKIPSPLVVLTVSIVLAKLMHLDKKYLVHFDQDFIHTIAWNERFDGIQHIGVFVKYVLMFAVVGSLESLLTVKAMDVMDPYQRKSNANKDLMAVGFGNILSSIVGGLPMISEVARSSANIHNGAKTRFANFFHGLFMLIFLFFDLRFSDLIPNAALAALLIGVGLKLASPKEFGRMAKIGFEQLLGFTVTIIVTLLTDLLIGIAAGITVKLIVQGLLGAPMARMFSAKIIKNKNHWDVVGAAVFSNWLGIRKQLEQYTRSSELNLDFSRCNLVDHTVMDNLLHLQMEFDQAGGRLNLIGLDSMKSANKNKHIAGALNRPKQERLNKNGEVKYKP